VIDVRSTSAPDDFPYRTELAERDVSAQDWATFINFLFPNHAAKGNEAIIDRKLRAEEASDAGRPSTGRSHAELQLDGFRERAAESPRTPQPRSEVEATVRQWNQEFFLPRGINICLPPASGTESMPGSWDAAFDRAHSNAGPSAQPQSGKRGSLLSNIHLHEDGIQIGDNFLVDSNQMRIGRLVLDNRGIRMSRPGEQARSPVHSYTTNPLPFLMGRRSQSQTQGPPQGQPQSHPQEERGRHAQSSGITQPRARSPSDVSVSSEDSISSDSSIGSLPDYDDIHAQQLPLYTSRLSSWLAQPDQVRTKADVKQLTAELKGPAPPTNPGDNQPTRQTEAELKARAKSLSAQWKQLKKEQRKERRQKRKERRQRKKAERKERKQRRKEIRKAESDLRKGRA
jgi:collagen type V/XI/XXIV/XXVII alpha